ncbi:MAG TPA: flagellar assembly protein A [Chloroflexota bacterium]|nr:flagellar assembly protein A [Chloroflexota bacterium]
MSTLVSDLRFNIRVIDGGLGLGLTMEYIPHMGSPAAHAQTLMAELNRRNVVYGLDQQAINHIMEEHVLHEEVIVAHGTPAHVGKDAELDLLLLPPTFLAASGETGQVDYKNIDNVSQVKAGDVISRGTASEPGEPGMNIFGKDIRPRAVRERIRHPAGKNTAISEDGLEMSAAKDGYLRWNGDLIDVCELFLVQGDVDLRTGNVRYDGEVEVYGNVQPGFEVVAGESVHIFGSVEGRVESEQGSVTISHGAMGTDGTPASVTARGDVKLGHARFARIESKAGNVTASFAVEHSEIHAAGDLTLLAGPAMSCVVEVGGKVDVIELSDRTQREAEAQQITQSSEHNRRQYVRVVVSPPPEVLMLREGGETLRGSIHDLSASGIRVRLDGRLREGERRNLQFKIDGVDGTMWMEAEVVRECVPLNSEALSKEKSFGLSFVHVEPAVREAIVKYCVAEDLRQHRLTGHSVGER